MREMNLKLKIPMLVVTDVDQSVTMDFDVFVDRLKECDIQAE